MSKSIPDMTIGMYYEEAEGCRRYPNVCAHCEIQFDCVANAHKHHETVHPGDVQYIMTWVILQDQLPRKKK